MDNGRGSFYETLISNQSANFSKKLKCTKVPQIPVRKDSINGNPLQDSNSIFFLQLLL